MVGMFKLRLTVSCATASRHPVIFESHQPFLAGKCLGQEGFFRIPIPVNTVAGPEQLREWRIEFEVLHKFPSAPIYSVVARAWISPDVLAEATAVDLFSTVDTPTLVDDSKYFPTIRVDFASVTTSSVPVNSLRVVATAVIWIVRIARRLADAKRSEAEKLEKEIRFIAARNQTERQDLQIDLMMRTVQVMNKYMEKGSRPDEWISAMQRQGLVGPDDETKRKVTEVASQLEALRNDVLKILIEKQNTAPVVQYVQALPQGAPSSGGLMEATSKWINGIAGDEPLSPPPVSPPPQVEKPASVAEIISRRSQSVSRDEKAVPEKPAEITANSIWGALTSALGGSAAQSKATSKTVSRKSEPATPKNISVQQGEESRSVTPDEPAAPAEVPAEAPKKAAVKKPPSGKLNTAPLVAAVKASPPKKPVAVKPAVKEAMDPKAKAIMEMKAKQAAIKAKIEMITKIKQLEAKRKVEIETSAKAIADLAKKLPPVDSKKFIGLPGPPPFAPKAKAKPPTEESGIPSVLAPQTEDIQEPDLDNVEVES